MAADARAEQLVQANNVVGLMQYLGPMWIVVCMEILEDLLIRRMFYPNPDKYRGEMAQAGINVSRMEVAMAAALHKVGKQITWEKYSEIYDGKIRALPDQQQTEIQNFWRAKYNGVSKTGVTPGLAARTSTSEEWVPQAPGPGNTIATGKLIRINSDAETFQNNLGWAKAAIAEARRVVPFVGNKAEDVVATLGTSRWAAKRTKAKFENDGKTYSSMLESCRALAENARREGAGNCGEVSAIAFIYLHDRGVRPIDWMKVAGGDHNFVLIARKSRHDRIQSTWGERCVVCDPWQKVAGPVSSFTPADLSCAPSGEQYFASELRVE